MPWDRGQPTGQMVSFQTTFQQHSEATKTLKGVVRLARVHISYILYKAY